MLAFTVIVAILVSAAAIAYVVWPLIQSGPAPVVIEDDRLTDLIERKDATLVAIKELEFDYHTSKLSDEDYQLMDQRLRRQAIGYIQQIEKLAPESSQMDGRIEAEIAGLRKTADTTPALAAPAAQPAPIAQSVTSQPQPIVEAPASVEAVSAAVSYCTNCGKPVQPGHKFCANCGTPVPETASVPIG
jgi:hypothetical protein